MDSQHRHELRENDLAEFLFNFRRWWDQHGKVTMLGIVIVAVAFAGWRLYRSNAKVRHEQEWSNLALSTGPEAYLRSADESQSSAARQLALVRGADLWAKEAAFASAVSQVQNVESGPPVETMLQKAENAYQRVLNDPEANPLFQLNAALGMAAIAETRRQWQEAANWYNQTIQRAGQLYPAHAEQARRRLAMLDDLAKPVPFAAETAESKTDASGAELQDVEPQLAAPDAEISPSDQGDAIDPEQATDVATPPAP